jgi:diaminopimelate decarboxylase
VSPPARPPWPRTAAFDGGRLTGLGGVDVADLAAAYGTPLYVLDRADLVARMRAYRRAFGEDVAVTYAAKALCVTGVLQIAAAEGLHVDVASAGELATAERAGVAMERVVFHGNNKSVDELDRAVHLGVGRIVADSFTELERLEEIGARQDRRVPVVLRVTPGVEASTHAAIRTGHDDSKFGFTLSAGLAHAAVERVLACAHLDLVGLHCHVGSQLTTVDAFTKAAAAMVEVLAEARAHHGDVAGWLNLGGGLGIAYQRGDDVVDLDAYAAALHSVVRRESDRHGIPAPSLAIEPGRSIVGPAGVTLYTVGTVKEIAGVRTYAAVDGGMSDNPRPALYQAGYEFAVAGRGPPVGGTRPVTVAGKHCESGDVLGWDVALPDDLTEGSLLAVAATGAYSQSMASNYNRLPRPAMVLVGDGQVDLLLRRETLAEVLAHDVPLDM